MSELGTILMLNSERGWRGGEVQTFLTATGLARAGISVVVGCPAGSPLMERLVAVGITTVPLSQRGSLDLCSVRRLRSWLATHSVAMVHAHTAHAHSVAALALIGRHEPLIVTRRVVFPLKRTWFTRWKYHRVSRLVAISISVQTVLENAGISKHIIDVIRDGIDVAEVSRGDATGIHASCGIADNAPVVACVANLSHDKDHPTLLRAWQIVERTSSHARLVLVGGGDHRSALETMATDLGLKRVHFAGFRTDVPNWLTAADVVALTSQHEGLGSILMDAQACGKPVVATAAGGIPEIVADGVAGFVVPVGDHAAVADRLLRVLGDAELRQRLGAAGRARAVSEFDTSHLVTAHLALYRRIAAGSLSP